jgi:chemotaxis signal transduction protein
MFCLKPMALDTIQNAFATEPDSLTSSGESSLFAFFRDCLSVVVLAGQNAEATILVASLREIIRTQAQEIESLQQKLSTKSSGEEVGIALRYIR